MTSLTTMKRMENIKTSRTPYDTLSKYKLDCFIITMWFNNNDFVIYSSQNGFLDPLTPGFEKFKKDALALIRYSETDCFINNQNDQEDFCVIYSLIRKHPECNIVLTLLGNGLLTHIAKNELYEKSRLNLERICINHLDLIANELIKFDQFKYYYILANKSLRDAVIRQGYEDQINISARELECLWIVSQSCSAKEAARIMNISPSTTEKYLKKIKAEFNGKSIPAIVVECIHRGIFGKMHHFK